MDKDKLVKAFANLAACGCTQELVGAMRRVLTENYQDSQLRVYELIPARIANEKQRSTVVYKNSDTLEVEGRVEEHEDYRASFHSKEPVYGAVNGELREFVIPVVLSDLNISHMLSLTSLGDESKDKELLENIALIFSSLFKTLHEKNYDPLTRVLNRQAFDNACNDPQYFGAQPSDPSVRPFGVIAIIDIDFFKSVNDQYGHAIGDEVLVLFCQLLSSTIRDEDNLFRYGGEEFVLFLRGDNLKHASAILERCRLNIEERKFPQVGRITLSAGFTKIVEGEHPLTQLLKADRALYYAKETGRNSVHCYEELLESGLIEQVGEDSSDSEFWFSEANS